MYIFIYIYIYLYTYSDAFTAIIVILKSHMIIMMLIIPIVMMKLFMTYVQYAEEDVPEARFTYDLSPMAVLIKKKCKHWYQFVTSMCALIGGTFTVVGLLSTVLNIVFKAKKG
jgi:hypothetical protein